MNDSVVLGAFHFDSDHKLGAHYDSLTVCRLEMDLFCFFLRWLRGHKLDATGDPGRPVMDSRRTHAASGPVSIRATKR